MPEHLKNRRCVGLTANKSAPVTAAASEFIWVQVERDFRGSKYFRAEFSAESVTYRKPVTPLPRGPVS